MPALDTLTTFAVSAYSPVTATSPASATPLPIVASYNGQIVALSFQLGPHGLVKNDFNQLAINIMDNSNAMSDAKEVLLTLADLEIYFDNEYPNESTANKTFNYNFVPQFSTNGVPNATLASSISYYAVSNNILVDFNWGALQTLPISSAPPAPLIGDLSMSFEPNPTTVGSVSAGAGVVIKSGSSFSVQLPKNVNKYKYNINGTAVDGTVLNYYSGEIPITPSNYNTDKVVTLPPSSPPTSYSGLIFKADTDISIYLQCEGVNNLYSNLSNKLTASASIRLPAPYIASAESLQNQMITVSGTILEQKPGLTTPLNYSIFAIGVQDWNQSRPLANWLCTDVMDQPVPACKPGQSPSVVVFQSQVNSIAASVGAVATVPLALNKGYLFLAVQYAGNINLSKSLDIKAASSPPSLTQSPASNMDKSGVTVAYVNDNVAWGAGDQVYNSASNTLTFNPVLTPSPLMTLPTLAYASSQLISAQQIRATYTLYSQETILSPLVKINELTTQTNKLAVPAPYPANAKSFWTVPNVQKGALYILEVSLFSVLLPGSAAAIQGTAAIATSSKDNFTVVPLGTYSTTVQQAKSSADIPVPLSLNLSHTTSLSTVPAVTAADGSITTPESVLTKRTLVASNKSPSSKEFAALGLLLQTISYEVIEFQAQSPDAFESSGLKLLTSSGSSALTVAASPSNSGSNVGTSGLVPEVSLIQLYTSAQNGNTTAIVEEFLSNKYYTARSWFTVLDLKSNQVIDSDKVYSAPYLVTPLQMAAPASVSLQNSFNSDSVLVNVTSVVKSLAGLYSPLTWNGDAVLPTSFRVEVLDENGETVGTATKAFTYFDDYNNSTNPGSVSGSVIVNGVKKIAGQTLYATAAITYNRLKADGITLVSSQKIEGALFAPMVSMYVPGPVEVYNLKMVLSPSGTTDRNKATSFKILAEVDFGGANTQGAFVKTFVAGKSSVNAAVTYEQGMTYDGNNNVWTTASLLLDPNTDYNQALIVAIAYNSNGVGVEFIAPLPPSPSSS